MPKRERGIIVEGGMGGREREEGEGRDDRELREPDR